MYQPIWFVFLAGREAVCVLTGHEVWFPVGPVITWQVANQDMRDWWTKSSDFATGQVKKNMYPLGCGVSVIIMGFCRLNLPWLKMEQRGVSKNIAPPIQPLDFTVREVLERLELLLYRWINSFQGPFSHWAFLSVWIYCWKRFCKVLIWTSRIFPVTVQGLAQARSCSHWSSDVVTVWSPCFGGWDNLIVWPWSDSSRGLMSQKTVTFNKLLLR